MNLYFAIYLVTALSMLLAYLHEDKDGFADYKDDEDGALLLCIVFWPLVGALMFLVRAMQIIGKVGMKKLW